MEFCIVGVKEFQIFEKAFLRGRFNILIMIDCCLKSGEVEERFILVFGFC